MDIAYRDKKVVGVFVVSCAASGTAWIMGDCTYRSERISRYSFAEQLLVPALW
jgi:hypothetical protein